MSPAAIAAAHQATEAAAALLLHATEEGGFGDVDVVALLAGALALSIDIHRDRDVEQCDTEYRLALEELRGSADRFLEAWSG